MVNTDSENFDIEDFLIQAPLYEQLIEEYLNSIRKRVICVETNVIYDSIKEAERLTGISHSNISRCCNGKYASCCEFHFYFIDDDKNIIYPICKSKERKEKQVIRLEGLIIYKNIQEASKLNNVSRESVRRCCCNGIEDHVQGYHFEYYDKTKKYIDLSDQYKKPDYGAIKVQCIETQQFYFSMREAARRTGATVEGIRKCCNGKGKTSGGFHWKFYIDE